ncbi:P-loop containing nucleoside triphosphate hydrolase [Pseudocohnilembus persalinus]|uniref:p-loop containing nucleoside triphosphate hydrolase n=1 Tax=Pseudocohnilembus persalinus TaxID=266149 RepID=A0A0V0QJD0_PSEPJ|nr:P-loop containing nucleoside triphosphate hydrolase [Pseudocohnilembus persalinus]|eukprot:KRX02216.1 P-loop containing nucleoside triphosphate hydrolase [Pseudocohnilembus persalinus]
MVCVRVRPPNKKEINQNNVQQKKTKIEVVKIQDDMVCLVDSDNVNNQGQINNNININQDSFLPSTSDQNSKKDRQYLFDYAFNQNDSTSYIFQKCISSLLDNVLIGYNATIFAYGQTGAGKTFTLFGEEFNHLNNELVVNENNQQGIVFESVKDLFNKIKQRENEDIYDVKISYLEIYNEKVHDLLIPLEDQSPLMIIEDTDRGVYVPDLTEYTIKEAREIFTYIKKGNKNRVMASTGSNQFSSRSHCMLQFNIEKKKKVMDVKNQIETSKLCLIDLAGSERAAISDNRGLRMQEGANINRSLLALGNCINILSDNQKKGAFVPYRDSKLTRLLKDSLGGNTKSIMLACIAPTYLTIEETLNTLKYAQRARKIKKTVEQNVKEVEMHISAYKDIISSLRGEIMHLKQYYDDLSQKIFSNLEECWEIQQSLKDLKQLNEQNEHDLQIKTQELARIKQESPQNQQEVQMINEQIKELKSIILNNQNIYYDMLKNMEQNQAEKKQIQQLVQTNISYSNYKQNNSQENLQQQKTYLSNYQETSIMRPKSNDKIVQMELEMIQMKIELQQKQTKYNNINFINNYLLSQKNDDQGKRQGLLKRQGSGSKSQKQLNNFEFSENPQKTKEKINSTGANLHGSYQGNNEKNKKQLQQYIKSPYNFKNSQNNLNNQNNRSQQTNRKDSQRSANNNRKNMGKIDKAISNNVSKEKNEQDLIKQFEQALEQQQKEKEKNKHNYELSIKQNKKTQPQKNQSKNCKEKIHNKSVLPKRNSYQSTIKEFQDKKANLKQKNLNQKNMGIRSVSPQQKQNYLKFQEKKQSKYNGEIQNLKLQQGEIDLITHFNNNKKKNTQALNQVNNNQVQTRQKSSFSSGNMENLQSTAEFYQNFIQSQNESERQNQNDENLQNFENNSQMKKVEMQIHVVEEEQDEDLENQSHNYNQINQNSKDKNSQKKNLKNNQMFSITNLNQAREKDDLIQNDMEYIKKFSKTTYNEQSNDKRFENQTKFENQQQDLEKIQKQNIQQIQQNNYIQNRPKKNSLYNQYSNNLSQGKQQVGILPGAFSKYNQNYSQNLNKIQKKTSVTISTAQNSKSGIIQKQQNKVKSNKSQHELSEKPKQNQQSVITTPMGLNSLSQLAHNYKFGFNSQQSTQQQKGFAQLQQNNQPYLYSPIQGQYMKNQSQNQQYSQSLQNSKQNISTGNNNNLGNQLNKYVNDNKQTQNWGKNQGLSYIQLSQKQKQRNQSNNRYASTKNSISSYKNILQKVSKSNQNLESSQD